MENQIYEKSKLPDQFKIGAIAPTHKKKKAAKNPDNYRRITMASTTIGKIVEKDMMTKPSPNPK